jgi:hypothetical protein
MKVRSTPILAWAVWAVIVAGLGLAVYFYGRAGHVNLDGIITLLAFFGFATVGALIVAYRPGNTIGWLFLGIGIGTGYTASSGAYVQYGAVTGAHLPLAPTLDWLGNVIWPINLCLGIFVLLLFPDGHLPGPHWRPLPWVLSFAVAIFSLSSAFTPGAFSGETTLNPYGILALAGPLTIMNSVSGLLLIPSAALAVVAVISRFWRSRGVQREQLKWVAYAAVLMALCILLGSIILNNDLGFAVGFSLIPLGAGAAILRNRLYDINVIINRTLVYGTLTVLLAALYFGCVVGAQTVLQALTGQRGAPPAWLIVATTLVIAALFNPLRRRIQAFIDHRFYRRKYDAAKTLAAFSATLRTETDLDQLSAHVVSVIDETMQPAHVSLWLRAPDRRRHV